MKDWSALEQVAAAMRRLNRAVAAFDAPEAELREIARAATDLSQRLEAGTPRVKEQEIASFPSFVTTGEPPASAVDAEVIEFDPFSLGGGRLNPSSIGIEFGRDGAAAVTARCTVHGIFQGPPGRVHGGVVALIIDELMGVVNRVATRRAFTARLQVHLRAPTPVDSELTFRAWEHDVDGRKVVIRAEGRHGDTLVAEADALFIVVATAPGDTEGSVIDSRRGQDACLPS
jgi:acyl-coenzyme A thioesterase PaaI-like protein